MKKILRYLSLYSFPLAMLVVGAFDLAQPDSLRNAMEAINMPSYLLLILGVFKVLGGLALILKVHWRLKEWAYAGFFIWAVGAISSHLLAGHSISEAMPVFFLLALLVLSFTFYELPRKTLSGH